MARISMTVFLLLAVLLGPAFCAGGLLEHACACEGEVVVESCEHEESCPDDPCQSLSFYPGHDSQVDLADISAPQVESIQPPAPDHEPFPSPGFLVENRPWPPNGWHFPYAKGDQPLII